VTAISGDLGTSIGIRANAEVEAAKSKERRTFTAVDARTQAVRANQEWERTDDGKNLRRLEAEVTAAQKKQKRARGPASEVPLPRSTR